MDSSSVYDSIKQTWNEKWWGEMERSHNWKLHRFFFSFFFSFISPSGGKEPSCAYKIYVPSILLLKINWNTWNATKSQNDCYVCTSVWFTTGVFQWGRRQRINEVPQQLFNDFHFESPIHRSLINLITMGFHILFPHSFVSPSLWWLDPIVYAFLSFRVHWIFIEMEANGKSSKRYILWAPAEIIQSRYSVKLMSRIF